MRAGGEGGTTEKETVREQAMVAGNPLKPVCLQEQLDLKLNKIF